MLKLEFIRFIIVGILNTIIGLSVIYLLVYINIDNYIANISGYFIGLISSFLLNKFYTFKSKDKSNTQILSFFMVFVISYGVNLLILNISLVYFSSYISQLFAMLGYTIVNYILNKFITFKNIF